MTPNYKCRSPCKPSLPINCLCRNRNSTLKEFHVMNIRTYFNSMSEMFVPTSLWEQTKDEPLEIFSAVDASFIQGLMKE